MRIRVLILFNFESTIFLFKLHTDIHIYIYILRIILIVFYIPAAEFIHSFNKFPLLIYEYQNPKMVFLTCFKIICAKSGSHVYDAGTVFSCNKIACNNPEWMGVGSDYANSFKTSCL